jgi:hypothetical protein
LTSADHWTTYLCLREPVAGWAVREANPIAEVLFQATGLVPGLLIDSVATLVALTFIYRTQQFTPRVKAGVLGLLALTTSYAVVNNLIALTHLGLSPFGDA